MVLGLTTYLVIQNFVPSTMVRLFGPGHSDPSTKAVVARYVEELKVIGTMTDKPSQPHEPASRLARVKAKIEMVETIARSIEQALATKSAGCEFAQAAGDAIEKEIPAAVEATNNVLDRLFVEAEQRYDALTKENEALGWTGGGVAVNSKSRSLSCWVTRSRSPLTIPILLSTASEPKRAL